MFSWPFVVLAIHCTLAATEGPVVDTCYGKIRGQRTTTRGGRTVAEFLGVRYAKATSGPLKFLSPQEPDRWDGVQGATVQCSPCLQQLTLVESLKYAISGSEDCLCLNIFTPNVSATKKMPVIFYIYGGAFGGLSADRDFYGPEMLLDKDVVLCTFNHRVGVLGFLATEDQVLPGNFGMKDQAAALRWVRENIANFGGDKDSITLWGSSSGAASVQLHMVSPLTHELFERGISQSGSSLCFWAVAPAGVLRERSRHVAELIGCPFTPSKDFLTCLQNTPSETIVNTTHNFVVFDIDPINIWTPVVEPATVEDAFLTKSPWSLTSNKTLFAGFNYVEGGFKLCNILSGPVKEKFDTWNADFFGITPVSLLYNTTAPNKNEVTQEVRDFYFGKDNKLVTPDMTVEMNMMFSDFWFAQPMLDEVERHKGDVYLYYYDYNTSYSLSSQFFDVDEYFGAWHLDDLMNFFIMNTTAANFSNFQTSGNPDYQLSVKLIELWTSYVYTGVPAASGVTWPPVSTDALEYLDISTAGLVMKSNPFKQRRRHWKSLNLRTDVEDINNLEVFS